MKNLIGSTIHHYQILVKIRETATRVLYKAYDTQAHQHVGLEIVKIQGIDNSKLLGLLNAQAKENAKLVHPNIAVVKDSGIHDQIIFLVYNFLPTHPLRRLFKRKYSWQELARNLVSVTQALAHAHDKGICHGFLNPSSIVLDEEKNPILFDFGFEQIITNHVFAQFPGSWINKWGFEYCSPEQLNGDLPDPRSDVYAMGMILLEWMSGEVAFLETTILNTLEIRKSSSRGKVYPITITPPAVRKLMEKCIATNPADRYQSMQEVYIILARGALDMTITEKMVWKPLAIPASRPLIRRSLAVLGVVSVLAMVAGFIAINRVGLIFGNNFPADESAVLITSSPIAVEEGPVTSVITIPTSTPNDELVPTGTENSSVVSYPLFQETPIPSLSQTIQKDNINQLITISMWGIGDVNDLELSPDGTSVAVASSIGVFIFDSDDLKFQNYLDTRSWVSAIDYSPDGKTIAIGDRDGLIRLWNTETWQEIDSYSGHRLGILDLAFSPDGTKLASVALDNTLIQWMVDSKDNPSPVTIQVTGVCCVVYSTDSSRVITGGKDFKINVWDSKNLTVLQTATYSSKLVDMAIIKDSPFVVVGGSDRRVALVNIEGDVSIDAMGGLNFPLTSIAASPGGELIAGGDVNGGIVVWDKNSTLVWKTQKYLPGDAVSFNTLGSVHSLSFSPDGKLLFSGLQNGTLRVLDAITGEEIRHNQSYDAHTNKLAISHNSRYAISQHNNRILKVWDIWNGKLLYELQGLLTVGDPFSQDDLLIAVSSNQSTVKVYASASGQEIYSLAGHQDIKTIQFIKDDAQLAAGYDQILHLWSISSGQELKTIRNYEGSGCSIIYDLKESPVLYITNYNHIVENNQNRSVLCNFQKPDWMKAFFVNESSGHVAFGGNSQLAVIVNNETRAMDGVNLQNIVSVAISPNGDLLAAAYDDNTIHFWDITTRQELMRLFGHNDSITDLRFTPNGKILMSASRDGTIRLWGLP